MMTVAETLQQDAEPPVEVHESPAFDQLWALLRQIIPPLIAFLVGRGFIKDDVGVLLVTVGGVVAPIVVGQLKTRLRAMQLSNITRRVDNTIAKFK